MNWTRFYLSMTFVAFVSMIIYILIDPETFWQHIISFCFCIVTSVGVSIYLVALQLRVDKKDKEKE